MSRRTFTAPDAPEPAGPYSHAVCSGGLVAVAGQIGVDPSTGRLAGDDVATQTRQALRNVQAILESAGCGLADAIRIGVYLTDVADFAMMNEVYAEEVPGPYPARTTVYVGLPPAVKVEIDALARTHGEQVR